MSPRDAQRDICVGGRKGTRELAAQVAWQRQRRSEMSDEGEDGRVHQQPSRSRLPVVDGEGDGRHAEAKPALGGSVPAAATGVGEGGAA